jgi:DNA mismatch repair protein MutS
MQAEKNTPLMQQYFDIKAQYPDTLLLFQVGDFYELFFDDAKQAAAFLGIALTSRGKNNGEAVPLCGVPLHAKDHYLTKLIKGGFKVALCDQLEQATPGKLVARAVTQVLTPGTLTDTKLLDEKSSSYLFSFYPGADEWALLFGELLTAQLWATIIPAQEYRTVESELARFMPDELLVPDTRLAKPWISFFKKLGYLTTLVQGSVQNDDSFTTQWLPGFAQNAQLLVSNHASLQTALFYFYAYVKKTQNTSLAQFNQLFVYKPDDFLMMDAATQRNLDLTRNQHDGGRQHTLFAVLDGATTPMGSRMIKKWIARPLVKREAITDRQNAIELLMKDVIAMQTLQQLLAPLGDIERVIGRIVLGRPQIHDYCALKRCLQIVPGIKKLVAQFRADLFMIIDHHCGNFDALRDYLERALVDDPSANTIIKSGFDQQLDYMRELIAHSNEKLIALEQQEIAATGIQSLKVRYNNIFGYYIEITNPNKHLVPDHYMRRQTLVGKERYITKELQQLAYDIERAHAHIQERERIVFDTIKQEVAQASSVLKKLANALAHLDAIHGFAKVAYNNGYVRPEFTDSRDIIIVQGRHPIVEQNSTTAFIPNDTQLTDTQSLWIVTGPNMGGKSTYLRQVALQCVMAQCGSFIPAQRAQLPLLDRIFTRIGAGDNLAAGKSTFLVEMEETASICMQATKQSLVILDEVGRGTSTFDGLAIAQAVIEYLYEYIGARCLFATHYHELTQLSMIYPGIVPFYMASKKNDSGIIFLYKIVQGVADGSFGVEVAKLANIPLKIIERAQELLQMLTQKEKDRITLDHQDMVHAFKRLSEENKMLREQCAQLQKEKYLVDQIATINFDELSPKKAFDVLWQWKQELP